MLKMCYLLKVFEVLIQFGSLCTSHLLTHHLKHIIIIFLNHQTNDILYPLALTITENI